MKKGLLFLILVCFTLKPSISDLRKFDQFAFYQPDLARFRKPPGHKRKAGKYRRHVYKRKKNPYRTRIQFQPPFSQKLPIQKSFSPDSRAPHRGVLFAYSTLGHVESSQSGKVAAIAYMEGYENYVIIQHRRGYSTVYANLDHIIVSEGQFVKKGAMLGTLTKFKGLYFQLNHKRTALNPVKFLFEW